MKAINVVLGMRISKRNTVHFEGGDILVWIGHPYQDEILAFLVAEGKFSVAWSLIRIEVYHR